MVRDTHPVGVEICLWIVNDPVVAPELLQEGLVRIDRCVSDDGKVLETHGVSSGLEVVDEVDELGVNIAASARVGRLRVDDICTDGSAMAYTRGRRVEQKRRA